MTRGCLPMRTGRKLPMPAACRWVGTFLRSTARFRPSSSRRLKTPPMEISTASKSSRDGPSTDRTGVRQTTDGAATVAGRVRVRAAARTRFRGRAGRPCAASERHPASAAVFQRRRRVRPVDVHRGRDRDGRTSKTGAVSTVCRPEGICSGHIPDRDHGVVLVRRAFGRILVKRPLSRFVISRVPSRVLGITGVCYGNRLAPCGISILHDLRASRDLTDDEVRSPSPEIRRQTGMRAHSGAAAISKKSTPKLTRAAPLCARPHALR